MKHQLTKRETDSNKVQVKGHTIPTGTCGKVAAKGFIMEKQKQIRRRKKRLWRCRQKVETSQAERKQENLFAQPATTTNKTPKCDGKQSETKGKPL